MNLTSFWIFYVSLMNAVDAFQIFCPMGERYQLLEAGATKTQLTAMKFGMFFIGPKENALLIDDLAQRETYFLRYRFGQRQPLTPGTDTDVHP